MGVIIDKIYLLLNKLPKIVFNEDNHGYESVQ